MALIVVLSQEEPPFGVGVRAFTLARQRPWFSGSGPGPEAVASWQDAQPEGPPSKSRCAQVASWKPDLGAPLLLATQEGRGSSGLQARGERAFPPSLLPCVSSQDQAHRLLRPGPQGCRGAADAAGAVGPLQGPPQPAPEQTRSPLAPCRPARHPPGGRPASGEESVGARTPFPPLVWHGKCTHPHGCFQSSIFMSCWPQFCLHLECI